MANSDPQMFELCRPKNLERCPPAAPTTAAGCVVVSVSSFGAKGDIVLLSYERLDDPKAPRATFAWQGTWNAYGDGFHVYTSRNEAFVLLLLLDSHRVGFIYWHWSCQ